jgi:hypothetical protein
VVDLSVKNWHVACSWNGAYQELSVKSLDKSRFAVSGQAGDILTIDFIKEGMPMD